MEKAISLGGINANLAPDAFQMWATHYYKCKSDFVCLDSFSQVPYFLLCRAIELAIKSKHLREKTQKDVEGKFGHHMGKGYNFLKQEHKILSPREYETLKRADRIYSKKGFEYFRPEDALTGYSQYPDLKALDTVARKLVGM